MQGRDRTFGRINLVAGPAAAVETIKAAAVEGAALIGSRIPIPGPDIEQLQVYTTQSVEKIRTVNGVVDVDSNFEPTQPELQVTVDLGSAPPILASISILSPPISARLIGGEEYSEFKDGDDQIVVRLRLDEAYRNNPALLTGDLLIPAGPNRIVQAERRRHHAQRAWTSEISRYSLL